jgi:GcrA cell cycle regulator
MADAARMASEGSVGALPGQSIGNRIPPGGIDWNLSVAIAGAPRAAVRGWPPERDAALAQLWADRSLSAAEIGRRLGVSKNAVIGRCHRLRLATRPSPIIRDANGATSRHPRRPQALPLKAMPSTREPLPAVVQTPEPIRVADRLPGLCCWPVGHPRTPGFAFCEEVSQPGKPYCEKHCQRAYVGRATACAGRAA